MNRKTLTRMTALVLAAVMLLGIFAGIVSASEAEVIVSDSEDAAIGIIGGADGPTAIFVSGNPGVLIAVAVVLVILVIGVVVIIKKRRK